jgi:two-component system CheB/CheR fusion protein
MPASAVASGCAGFVHPPRAIATELARIAGERGLQMTALDSASSPSDGEDGDLREILALIRGAAGFDFSDHKTGFVQRLICRRMLLKKIPSVRGYSQLLQGDRTELDALSRDIMLHVTRFFREAQAFQTLKTSILPELLEKKQPGKPLRVWVPGCSTGEEAYSIAMVLAERLGDREKTPAQIFGTDINRVSLEHARAGYYPGAALANVSKTRLARFFVESSGVYRVSPAIRDMCTFGRQDLTLNPPYRRIDLISCRNLLMYFDPAVQRRVIEGLHLALNDHGMLLMGKADNLDEFADLFAPAEEKKRFFRKRSPDNSSENGAASFHPGASAGVADRAVWNSDAHAGVLVNDSLQVLHFRGDTGRYLASASGPAGLHRSNLFKMIRGDLLEDLRAAFLKAQREKKPARIEGIQVNFAGRAGEACVEVLPLAAVDASSRHYLVLFETRRQADDADASRKVVATYEEPQTANEEWEAAQEELESANKQLIALTGQQASRNAELAQANDDLNNVFEGLSIPILLLDGEYRVRRFNRSAEQVFNLSLSDTGRPFQNVRPNLDLHDLQPLISRELETLAPQSQEVRDRAGRYYAMSVRPYKTSDHRIDGGVIKLFDIDAMKRTLLEAERARDYTGAIVDTVREPLVVLGRDHRIVNTNRSFRETFHFTEEEVTNRGIFELAGGGWENPDLRRLLENMAGADARFHDFKLTHAFPWIGRRTLLLNARQLHWKEEIPGTILLVMEDITERESFLKELKDNEERLRFLTAGLLSAHEEERGRISRELHDDFNQRLAMLAVELGALETGSGLSAQVIQSQLAALRARTEGISDDIRRTAHRLHPSVVDHLGLPSALRSLCRDFSKDNLQVHYRQRSLPDSIPADIAISLYRVVQEALRNVERHSKASQAAVTLTGHRGGLRLIISDAGVGFGPDFTAGKKGLGIVSMEERVRLVAGTFQIRSRPGGGTRIAVAVQLPEAAPAREE